MDHYRQTQVGWLLIAILAGIAILLFLLAGADGAVRAPALLLVGVLFLVTTLTVTVDDRDLKLHFGIGLIRRRTPLATIRAMQRVRNPWSSAR